METAWACVVLTLAMLLVFPAFALYGHSNSGPTGILAAGIAAGVCWLSMVSALLFVGWLTSYGLAVHATLIGMALRMGPPMLFGLVLTRQGGELAAAGVLGMIVVYYLIGLVIETLLSLYLVGSTGQSAKAS